MLKHFIHTDEIKLLFSQEKEVKRASIINFIRSKTNLDSATYAINSLLKRNIIQRTGHGKYAMGGKKLDFLPEIGSQEKKINKLLAIGKPLLNFCVWRSSIINEFTLHQPGTFFIFVEVEKIGAESVFFLLQEHFKNVYFQPTAEVIDRYISNQNEAIIVLPLISQAPLIGEGQCQSITLEKLLVDLVRETKLYQAFQGAELSFIFKTAFEKYQINKTKMLRYASRRGVKAQLEKRLLAAQTEENND
jgi:hypothetical protein